MLIGLLQAVNPSFSLRLEPLCSTVFARPWFEKNCHVAFGSICARRHQKLKPNQLFVVIPIEFVDYFNDMDNLTVDIPNVMKMTRPRFAEFLENGKRFVDSSEEAVFSLPWDDNSKKQLNGAPAASINKIISSAESWAIEMGYNEITEELIREMWEDVGINLEEIMKTVKSST